VPKINQLFENTEAIQDGGRAPQTIQSPFDWSKARVVVRLRHGIPPSRSADQPIQAQFDWQLGTWAAFRSENTDECYNKSRERGWHQAETILFGASHQRMFIF
jgi:hypothetical protein